MEPNFEHSALADFLTRAQHNGSKSDEDMAEALGFSRANVYRAIKAGKMKMPFEKVPALARTLDVSQSDALEAILRDYSPELLELIQKVWGPVNLTANEKKLLIAYRTLAHGQDVEPLVMDGGNVIALITT
jgi:hypothetical protein